jgi:hypothetical protein
MQLGKHGAGEYKQRWQNLPIIGLAGAANKMGKTWSPR